MKNKQSKYIQEFKKQQSRLRSLMRRWKKKGFMIALDLKKPAKIDKKKIEQMKSYNIESLTEKKKVYIFNPKTGDFIGTARPYDIEKSKIRTKKQQESEDEETPEIDYTILYNVRSYLESPDREENDEICAYCLNILESEIDEYGEDVIALRVNSSSYETLAAAQAATYSYDGELKSAVLHLLNIITGGVDSSVMQDIDDILNRMDREYREKLKQARKEQLKFKARWVGI